MGFLLVEKLEEVVIVKYSNDCLCKHVLKNAVYGGKFN
jgi:hypothetical protein